MEKNELEKITIEISKDLNKYQLTFPEMTIVLSWILQTYGFRVLKTGDPNLIDTNQQKL